MYYSIKNNNLSMLKFGIKFNRKNFLTYLKNNIYFIKHNDDTILKWIVKYYNYNIDASIFKNFNINYYYEFEGDILIKYISKYSKNMYLCYKIKNLTEKKYKILLWLLLNTKISKYDIELLSLENKESTIQKSLYELLYSLEIQIDFDLFNKNYIKNTRFIKKYL